MTDQKTNYVCHPDAPITAIPITTTMMQSFDGKPGTKVIDIQPGITKREYFACMAISTGLLYTDNVEDIVSKALHIADELIYQLNNPKYDE